MGNVFYLEIKSLNRRGIAIEGRIIYFSGLKKLSNVL